MNKVILTGNLTKEPEIKRTAGGKVYLQNTIAVQRKYNREEADFLNIVAWEQTAQFIKKYFLKGSRIIIEGRLQTSNYTDAQGAKRYSVDVIVEGVEFGGSKKTEPAKTAKPAETKKDDFWDDDFIGEEISDDSVPFA